MFRHILAAIDCDDSSEQAPQTATALATCFGPELTVLHVIEKAPQAIAHEICFRATELRADLVVIGCRARRKPLEPVLESVAARVVRLSPAPVLTVHSSDHAQICATDPTNHPFRTNARSTGQFHHILAPTDLSDVSQQGVDAAVALALELDASLTLVHVCELPSYRHYVLDDLAAEVEARARRELDELERVRARLPKAEGVLRRGVPWQRILDVAEERRADLVVVGTHGRQGIERVLVGSVAETLARVAPVAVLTVAQSKRRASHW